MVEKTADSLPPEQTVGRITPYTRLNTAVFCAEDFLVDVEPADKTVRINITAREKQIEQIDRLANEAGMTRSAYMIQRALCPGAHRI